MLDTSKLLSLTILILALMAIPALGEVNLQLEGQLREGNYTLVSKIDPSISAALEGHINIFKTRKIFYIFSVDY